MNDTEKTETSTSEALAPRERIFLVVVDQSEEFRVAVRYAAKRASNTGGRVALLHVTEVPEHQQWQAVEDLMREELRQKAEETLQQWSKMVQEWSGKTPVLIAREGIARDELLKVLKEENSVSVLVLATASGKKGPGPLISALTGKMWKHVTIPMTIVPGDLSDDVIDALT
jgi:nucleotide-binding universal stress UspA family protein